MNTCIILIYLPINIIIIPISTLIIIIFTIIIGSYFYHHHCRSDISPCHVKSSVIPEIKQKHRKQNRWITYLTLLSWTQRRLRPVLSWRLHCLCSPGSLSSSEPSPSEVECVQGLPLLSGCQATVVSPSPTRALFSGLWLIINKLNFEFWWFRGIVTKRITRRFSVDYISAENKSIF